MESGTNLMTLFLDNSEQMIPNRGTDGFLVKCYW